MPEIPKVNNCCFVATLETGCKIIGFIEVILNLITFIRTLVYLIQLTTQHAGQEGSGVAIGEALVLLVSAIFGFFIGLCLLWGVYKKNPSLVRIWIIVNVVLLIIALLSLIIGIFSPGISILESIIRIILEVYCLLVVYSYYTEVTGT